MGPGLGGVRESAEVAHVGAARRVLLVGGGHDSLALALEDGIARQPQQVVDVAPPLVELLEHSHDARHGEARVAAHHHPYVGEALLERDNHPAQHSGGSSCGVGGARPQNGGDELARGAVEHQQRVVHVGVVEAVEERELLLAVRGVVRAIDVEHHHLGGRGERVEVVLLQHAQQLAHAAPVHSVLQAAERGLRGQGRAAVRHQVARHLEARVMTQGVRVVAVFVAQGHLVDALAHLLQTRVHHPRRVACVGNAGGQLLREPQTLVHQPQQQRSPITRGVWRVACDVNPKSGVEMEDGWSTVRHAGGHF